MNLLEEIINKEIKEVKCKEEYYILFAEGKYKQAKEYYIKNIEYLPNEESEDTTNYVSDYNRFCSDIYIKKGRPPCYIIEIEKIKNDPKTKTKYIESVKEKSEKRIKQLKDFLEKYIDKYETDFKKLNKLYEEKTILEKQIRKLRNKYDKYFVKTDIEYEYNLPSIIRKLNSKIHTIYTFYELACIKEKSEISVQLNILITYLNSLRNDFDMKKISENEMQNIINDLPTTYRQCTEEKIKRRNKQIIEIRDYYLKQYKKVKGVCY